MARTAGARNADFVQRRKALIDKARLRLSSQDGGVPSSRELALAAGVSVPTLRHYFGTREALVKAVFTNALEGASVHLQRARSADHVGEALAPGFRQGYEREPPAPEQLLHRHHPQRPDHALQGVVAREHGRHHERGDWEQKVGQPTAGGRGLGRRLVGRR